MSSPDVVAVPVILFKLMVAGLFFAILVMLVMLSIEIMLLFRIEDLHDLIQRLVPPA